MVRVVQLLTRAVLNSSLLSVLFFISSIPAFSFAAGNDVTLESHIILSARILDEVSLRYTVHPSEFTALRAALAECEKANCKSSELDLLRKTLRAAESWNLPSAPRNGPSLEKIWGPVALALLRMELNASLQRRVLDKSLEILKGADTAAADALNKQVSQVIEGFKKQKPRKLDTFLLEAQYIQTVARENSPSAKDSKTLSLISVYAACLKQDKDYQPCRTPYDKLVAGYTAVACKKPTQIQRSFLLYGAQSDKAPRYPRLIQDAVGHTYYSSTSSLAQASSVDSMSIVTTDYGALVITIEWKNAEAARLKKRLKEETPRFLLLFSEGKLVVAIRTRNQSSPHSVLNIEFPNANAEALARSNALCVRSQRALPRTHRVK